MAEAQLKKINSAEWLSMAYTRITELLDKSKTPGQVDLEDIGRVKKLFEKAYSPKMLEGTANSLNEKIENDSKDPYFHIRRANRILSSLYNGLNTTQPWVLERELPKVQKELTLHKNAHPEVFGRVDIDSYKGEQPYSEFLVSRGTKEVEKEDLVDFLASQMQYLGYDLGRAKPDAKEIARKKNAIYNNVMALKEYAKGSEALTGLFASDFLDLLSKNISSKKYSGAQENLRDISDILAVYRGEQEALPNVSQPAPVEEKKTEKPPQPTVAEPKKKAKVETAETESGAEAEEPRGEKSKAAWKLYAATPRMRFAESDGYNKLKPLNAEQQTKRLEDKLGFTAKMENADAAEAQKLHNGIYIMVLGRGYDATLKTFSNMKDIATVKEMLLYMWDSEKGASKLADDMRKEKYGGKSVLQGGVAWWAGNFKVVVGEVEPAKKEEKKEEKPAVAEEKKEVEKKEQTEAKYYSSMAEIRKEFKQGFPTVEGGSKMRASPEKLSGAMLQLNSELNALLLQRKQEGKPGVTKEEIEGVLSRRGEKKTEPTPAVEKVAVNIQPKTDAPAKKEEKWITFDPKNRPLAEKTTETAEKKDKAEKSGVDAAKAEAEKKAAVQKQKEEETAKAEADKKAAEQKKAEQDAAEKLRSKMQSVIRSVEDLFRKNLPEPTQASKEAKEALQKKVSELNATPPAKYTEKDYTELTNLLYAYKVAFQSAQKQAPPNIVKETKIADSTEISNSMVTQDSTKNKLKSEKIKAPQAYAYKDELAKIKWVHDILKDDFAGLVKALSDMGVSAPESAIQNFVKAESEETKLELRQKNITGLANFIYGQSQ